MSRRAGVVRIEDGANKFSAIADDSANSFGFSGGAGQDENIVDVRDNLDMSGLEAGAEHPGQGLGDFCSGAEPHGQNLEATTTVTAPDAEERPDVGVQRELVHPYP